MFSVEVILDELDNRQEYLLVTVPYKNAVDSRALRELGMARQLAHLASQDHHGDIRPEFFDRFSEVRQIPLPQPGHRDDEIHLLGLQQI